MTAMFEFDINGDLQPTGDPLAVDVFFELDENGDIQPKLVPSTPPSAPTLTIIISGSTATFEISGADSGTDNDIYVKDFEDEDWPATPDLTIVGNGSDTGTYDVGKYWAFARSVLEPGVYTDNLLGPLYFRVNEVPDIPERRYHYGGILGENLARVEIRESYVPKQFNRLGEEVFNQVLIEITGKLTGKSINSQIGIGGRFEAVDATFTTLYELEAPYPEVEVDGVGYEIITITPSSGATDDQVDWVMRKT